MVDRQKIITEIDKKNISFIFISVLILTYPINVSLFAIRPVDVAVILFAAVGFKNFFSFKKRYLVYLIFWCCFGLSIFNGIIRKGIVNYKHFIFVYKYILPFLLLILISRSEIKYTQIRKLLYLLLLSVLVLAIYEFVFLAYYKTDFVIENLTLKYRPTFPFTKPFINGKGYKGDAHVLSSFFSNAFLAIFLCRYYKIFIHDLKKTTYIGLIMIVSLALIMTNSRNGVFTILVILSCWLIYKFFSTDNKNWLKNKKGIAIVSISFLFIVLGIFVVYHISSMDMPRQSNITRTFYFNFKNEQSSMQRITNLFDVWKLVKNNGLILGIGMQSSSKRFFDGGISALLVSSGIMGLIAFMTSIMLFLVSLYKQAKENKRLNVFVVLLLVFLNYSLACLITEFFLVSRSVVPVMLFIGLLAKLISIEN